MRERADVAALEVGLGGLAVDAEVGREAVAREEEREEREARELVLVRRPDHAPQRPRVVERAVDHRRARLAERGDVEADLFEGPGRRAAAAAEAAPDVLVRVDDDGDAEGPRGFDDAVDVRDVVVVVDARRRVLDGVPGDDEAHDVEAPGAQAPEVGRRVGEREGPAHVGRGRRVVDEGRAPVRRAVHGDLRAGEVHAAQRQPPAQPVDEGRPAALDLEGRQAVGQRGCRRSHCVPTDGLQPGFKEQCGSSH